MPFSARGGFFAPVPFVQPPAANLWTPAQIPSLLAWHDASDLTTITESGGLVSQWDDKSGNNYHISQATGSLQPTLVTNQFGGKAAIQFDGVDDYLTTTAAGIAGAADGVKTMTLFTVADIINTGSFDLIGGWGGATVTSHVALQFQTDGRVRTLRRSAGTGGVSLDSTSQYAGQMFYIATNKPSTLGTAELRVDGGAGAGGAGETKSGSLTDTGSFTGGWYTVGDLIRNGVPTIPFDGYVQKFLAFDGELTQLQKEKLEGWAAWDTGLESLLPTGHPYKSAPPLADIQYADYIDEISTWNYNTANGTASKPDAGVNVNGHANVKLDQNRLLIWPITATSAYIYDHSNGTFTDVGIPPATAARNLVLHSDGNVYSVSNGSYNYVMKFDPNTNTFSSHTVFPSAYAWMSLCELNDGRLFLVPQGTHAFAVVDPTDWSYEFLNMNGTGAWHHAMPVMGNAAGDVYVIPGSSRYVFKYTAATNTMSTIYDFTTSSNRYRGGELMPDGKIYAPPQDVSNVLIIDPATDTVTTSTLGLAWSGSQKHNNIILATNGVAYSPPNNNATKTLAIDFTSGSPVGSLLDIPTFYPSNTNVPVAGTCMSDGTVLFWEYNATTTAYFKYVTDPTTTPPESVMLSRWHNNS